MNPKGPGSIPELVYQIDGIKSGFTDPRDPLLLELYLHWNGRFYRLLEEGMNPLLAFRKTFGRKDCPLKIVPGSYQVTALHHEAIFSIVGALKPTLEQVNTTELQGVAESLLERHYKGTLTHDFSSLLAIGDVLRERAHNQHISWLWQWTELFILRVNAWLAGWGSTRRVTFHGIRIEGHQE